MRHAGTRPGRSHGTIGVGVRSASSAGRGAGRLRPTPLGLLTLALVALLGSACASERPRPIRPADDLHDPNPSVRSVAVSEVARRGDERLIPELIELLDDDDGAVRLVAGKALRDLTGRDSGYRAYAPEPELRRQVEEWRAWWASSPASRAPASRAPAPRAPAAAPPAPLVSGSGS